MKRIAALMMMFAMGATAASTPTIISSQVRASDPTIIDVVYKVTSDQPTVNVRALAFENGTRSFQYVVRPETFVKDPDGNETSGNIGDGIAANVEHKLAWKVDTDWKTDLAKVKFEILTSDMAQLPLKTQVIPATAHNPSMTIAYNSQTDANIFNALLWYYACKDEHLVNVDGYVDVTGVNLINDQTRWVDRTSIAGERIDILKWLYAKIGWEPLIGGNLMDYVRKSTRKDIWWNTSTQNCVIKSNTKPSNLYVGEKAYCVIDVSGGHEAMSYPVTYLDTEPVNGWGNEYKTTKILLRRCEPGQYMMQRKKQVTLTKPFYMGVFTITEKQYMQVMGSSPTLGNELYPVRVSLNTIRGVSAIYNWPMTRAVDPNSFIGQLQVKSLLNVDLPTESQWEYACRAGTSSSYGNGGGSKNDLRLMAYHNGAAQPTLVGRFKPNFWGFYDMHGNIGQWCLDWYGNINNDSAIDYCGEGSGTTRTIRGGRYIEYYGIDYTTSFARIGVDPSVDYCNYDGCHVGFRLAWTLTE